MRCCARIVPAHFGAQQTGVGYPTTRLGSACQHVPDFARIRPGRMPVTTTLPRVVADHRNGRIGKGSNHIHCAQGDPSWAGSRRTRAEGELQIQRTVVRPLSGYIRLAPVSPYWVFRHLYEPVVSKTALATLASSWHSQPRYHHLVARRPTPEFSRHRAKPSTSSTAMPAPSAIAILRSGPSGAPAAR